MRNNDTLTKIAVIPQLFTPEECARAIQIAQRYPPSEGGIGASNEESGDVRRSEIWFLNPTPETDFIFKPMRQVVDHINQGYGFDLGAFAEGCQIARYPAETRGHYDWHMDLGTGQFARRKLSLSVQLSNPADYDGGNLEFHMSGLDNDKMRLQGTLVTFPSYLEHRVTPVTRGERYSLVVWVDGPPFR